MGVIYVVLLHEIERNYYMSQLHLSLLWVTFTLPRVRNPFLKMRLTMAFPRRTLEGISELLNSINTKIQNALLPSGAIVWFKRQTAPTGWAICDGTNGTPNLIGRYPLGATSGIGGLVEAGLPNITGELNVRCNFDVASGAFYSVKTSCLGHNSGYTGNGTAILDASRSSAIYGNSATVQPPSQLVHICIKYK